MEQTVYGGQVIADLRLVDQGLKFTRDYMSLELQGTFMPANKAYDEHDIGNEN